MMREQIDCHKNSSSHSAGPEKATGAAARDEQRHI
uniref:Uncharacterized protein n=1 Tax=Arundo donax TaxID=35708 RepID=A0A0A9AGZ1_ARUDO